MTVLITLFLANKPAGYFINNKIPNFDSNVGCLGRTERVEIG